MPAIREKFPSVSKDHKIRIQQDNARPHAKSGDMTINAAGKEDGWDISLTCQPPNSPDLNVLDLGYFKAIQSIQHQMCPATVDELIQCVRDAYWQQPIETTENVFLSLQKVMECIMVEKGGNKYTLPHIGKQKIRQSCEQMPLTLNCSDDAINSALELL